MASLDLSIVNVAFPDIEASYPDATSASLAWIITAYSIVFGALLVVGGRTGDRLGRKRVFLGGIVVFLLGSFFCGIAPNVATLVGARALQGVGAAFLVPASVALLIGAYPPARRMQIVAQWGGIGALAVATGPSLGAAIVSAGGWRWAFFVNLPVGLFVLRVRTTGADRNDRRLQADEARLPRRRTDVAGAGVTGARHLRRVDVGLDRWTHPRRLRRGARGWRRVRSPHPAPRRSRHRSDAVPEPSVRHRQHRDRRVRHGVLRHAARQHSVPHRRLGLLDHDRRSRRHPRTGRRRHRRRPSRQVGRSRRFPTRAPVRRLMLRHRPRHLHRTGHRRPRTTRRRGSPAPCSSGSASASRFPSSAPAQSRLCHPHASPWAAPSTRQPARSAAHSGSPCSSRSSDPNVSSPIRSTASTNCGLSPPPPH